MDVSKLKKIATEVRKDTIATMAKANMGHPGGSLSQVEVLVALYNEIMNIRPEEPEWEERDRLIFSKGHACASYYTVLAHRGYFPVQDLSSFGEIDSYLQSHPDRNKTPGVENSSGSLGQGLSLAVGVALAAKIKNKTYQVYALLGDGECDSGQVWEALMAAAHHQLDNLLIIIDHNKLQAKGTCDYIMKLNPFADKLKTFNHNVIEIDGHDFNDIVKGINGAKDVSKLEGKPTVILSHTIKGKGVSFMENVVGWHNAPPTLEDMDNALKELGGVESE